MGGDQVLITGGAGFIGCHTAVALLDRGYRVRCLDCLRPPVHSLDASPPWLPSDVELLRGDVRDKEMVTRALRDVHVVLHLAAYQDYLPDFSTFFDINTVGTALLYEVIVEQALPIRKIVIASSQAVYGEGTNACVKHGSFSPGARSDRQLSEGRWEVECPSCGLSTQWGRTDETVVNPSNPYAVSKYTQELVALNLGRRYGLPTTCLRYSITQGRWQSPRNAYSGVCRIFTSRVLAGRPPILFEDGQQLRDYVHVTDVAKANVLALEDPRTDFEVFNVGGSSAVSTLEYAEAVIRVLGSDQHVEVPGLYRFGDTRHIVSDSTKLRELGWSSGIDVDEIVGDYAAWLDSTGFKDEVSDASLIRMRNLGTVRKTVPI